MRLWHITLSTRRRFVLAADARTRLAMVRAVVRIAGAELLLFSIADDHLHLVVACEPERARQIAGHVVLALRALGAPELAPPHHQPVADRKHLLVLARYHCTQTERHGLDTPPALWSGACFADLVGARVLPGFDPGAVRAHLPRLRDAEIFAFCDLDRLRPLASTAGLPPRRVVGAVSFASGLPDLLGKRPEAIAARSVAVALLKESGASTAQAASALGATPRAVQRAASRPADPALTRAARLALAVREAVLRLPSATTADPPSHRCGAPEHQPSATG